MNKDNKNVGRDFTYISDEDICAIENMENISDLDSAFFHDDVDCRLLVLNQLEEDALLSQDFGLGVEATY